MYFMVVSFAGCGHRTTYPPGLDIAEGDQGVCTQCEPAGDGRRIIAGIWLLPSRWSIPGAFAEIDRDGLPEFRYKDCREADEAGR